MSSPTKQQTRRASYTGPARSSGTAGSSASPVTSRLLPFVVLLFIGSGCAALIYEIVWFQLLSLIIGSSAVSLGVLLGTFMGGMCIGSLYLSRFVSRRQHPLRVYALLELAIAAFGLLVLWGLPYAGGLYSRSLHGTADLLVRGLFCALCLLPPTLLMGATLPAIARWVETTPEGVAWLGFFYGGNIAGAVLGCVLAGFYLLRVHDMAVATYVAVAIDVIVAAISIALARATAYPVADDRPPMPESGSIVPPAPGGAMSRAGCRARPPWPPRRCGRGCWRCCSARRRTRSR